MNQDDSNTVQQQHSQQHCPTTPSTMSDYFRADTPADHITTKLKIFHVDRIMGEPTINSYDILLEQLAVGSALITTTQWGGKFGHIPLILGDARFKIITNDNTAITEEIVAWNEVDPSIDGNTPEFEAKKRGHKWDIKIRSQKNARGGEISFFWTNCRCSR
jgi:hypothetical protein